MISSLELFRILCLQDIVIITQHLAFHRSGDITEPCKSFVTISESPRNHLKHAIPLTFSIVCQWFVFFFFSGSGPYHFWRHHSKWMDHWCDELSFLRSCDLLVSFFPFPLQKVPYPLNAVSYVRSFSSFQM